MSSSPTDHEPAVTAAPIQGAASVTTETLLDVTMPQMGVSMAEGTVVAWRKQVDEWVEADETVCEISTDKIDCEVPAPAAGRVVEILAELEQTVAVGGVLARIATTTTAGTAGRERVGVEDARAPAAAVPAAAAKPEHRHYSPVVRRIAISEGVDLARVPGSGRGGRVRKQDVLAFIAGSGNDVPASVPEAPAQAPLHTESPYREPSAASAHDAAPAAVGEAEPLSRMRRSIAAHMLRSLHTAAHCTSIVEVDMSGVERARRALGLTYLPFVARSLIDALREHPDLNATIEGESLTRHSAVNLGIAISLGRDGLIVPVIHDAHELAPDGLAKRISELTRRARAGELSPDDVHGGTFTLTNPGGYGTLASTPIINQPQVAILDLEAVVKRPVVVTDGEGGDAIAIRPIAYLCLSWDHRALDGALAAQFLGTVRVRIESWGDAR